MKKISLIIFFLPLMLFGNNNIVHKWGVNIGLNTFMLVGNTKAVESQFSTSSIQYGGGGLRYIEPGLELATTLFFDSAMKHRLIAGGEFIWMHAKEIQSAPSSYYYKYHKVQFGDIFAGYHYAFYEAPFQEVRIFAGLEMMLNHIFTNNLDNGLKQIAIDTFQISTYDTTYYANQQTRIGSRIRLGFEGRLYDNIYIMAGFTCGIYNLLLNDDTNGELFDNPNTLNSNNKETKQAFVNYVLSFQYRFNR